MIFNKLQILDVQLCIAIGTHSIFIFTALGLLFLFLKAALIDFCGHLGAVEQAVNTELTYITYIFLKNYIFGYYNY